MESYKEKKIHINGLEMKAESIAVRSMTKRKDTHSFENGQCNYGEVCQRDGGGGGGPILTKFAKDLWEYYLAKKYH